MGLESSNDHEHRDAYEAPTVVVLGSVEELTHATLEVFADLPEGSRPLLSP